MEWGNLEDEMNAKMRRFTSQLNHFYKEHKELWEIDDSFDGLEIVSQITRIRASSMIRKIVRVIFGVRL